MWIIFLNESFGAGDVSENRFHLHGVYILDKC